MDDVLGSWTVRDPFGDMPDGILTFAEDGTYKTVASSGFFAGAAQDMGTYHLDGNALVLASDSCHYLEGGEVYSCTATYSAFVAMAGDKPGSLRLTVVDDPDEARVRYLNRAHSPATTE